MNIAIKPLINQIKPYVRWFVLAITFAFIFHALQQNWRQVLDLKFTDHASASVVVAIGVTLLGHIWSGWIWYRIMKLLAAPVNGTWTVIVYLKTNLAKYLPGNVWHFVGRVQFLKRSDTSTGVAITGVMLEPLLMSAAALAIAIVSLPSSPIQGLVLVGVLVGVHPRILNPILERLTKAKITQQKEFNASVAIPKLTKYPIQPLCGEIVFVLLRGIGFLLSLSAILPINAEDWRIVLGSFSLAWLLGLVVPGAPGGIGVFEATALSLLTPRFPTPAVLGAVALYRVNGTIAEALGAGLAIVDEKWNRALAEREAKHREAEHRPGISAESGAIIIRETSCNDSS